MTCGDLPEVFGILEREFGSGASPVMDLMASQGSGAFAILAGTVLSARTKDSCTSGAIKRLLERAPNPEALSSLSRAEVERLIYPVGFYRVKAQNLIRMAGVLLERFGGEVPGRMEDLLSLPGVGRKTANLVLSLAFGQDAICVDVHVHRISNRFGLVRTKTPLETELALGKILPAGLRRGWNTYLVAFGQTRCKPVSPLCNGCPIGQWCDSCREHRRA